MGPLQFCRFPSAVSLPLPPPCTVPCSACSIGMEKSLCFPNPNLGLIPVAW